MSTASINRRHITAIVTAVCVAIILAPVLAQAGGPASRTTRVKGTVNVGNFPATQNVAGTVNVGNQPATQHVDGTVNVGNLPATQAVSGTVSVTSPTPYYNYCFGLNRSYTGGCDVSGAGVPSSPILIDDVSGGVSGIASGDSLVCSFQDDNNSARVVFIPMISEGAGEFVGNVSNLAFALPAGDSVFVFCTDGGSSAGELFDMHFTLTGHVTS